MIRITEKILILFKNYLMVLISVGIIIYSGRYFRNIYNAMLQEDKAAIMQLNKIKNFSFNKKKAIKLEDSEILEIINGKDSISYGKSYFITQCSSCHGKKAEGLSGPNLTDNYWLYSPAPLDVFKIIKLGMGEKGMPSFKATLDDKEISYITSFLKSVKGTNIKGASPQGKKYE